MKTKTMITALLAALIATAAAAQTAASAITAGGTYYVYNVKQQQYLADDGNGTLTLSDKGMPVTLTLADSDSGSSDIYFMTCDGGKISSSFLDADVKTDGTGQYDHWRISPVEDKENTYTIACRFRETAAFSFLYWGQVTQRLIKSAIMPGFDYEYGHWQFVTEEDYESAHCVITLKETATEYSAPTVTASNGATVRLERTLTLNSWNTFCVPFGIDAAQFAAAFGSDAKAAKFTGCDETTLCFTSQSSIEAGVPYLIYPTKAQLDGGYYEFTGVKTFADEPQTTTQGIVTFTPYFYQTTAPQGSYVIRKNVVYHLTSDMTMKGFRGYFVENSGSESKISEAWKLDGETTGIAAIETDDDNDAPVYNIAGQRVSGTAAKGVYIKNGKKHITK